MTNLHGISARIFEAKSDNYPNTSAPVGGWSDYITADTLPDSPDTYKYFSWSSNQPILNGTSDSSGTFSSQIITNTIDISGGGEGFINYNSDDTWTPNIPPEIEFIE